MALRGQQRGLEGAGSGALTRSEHLAGEMMKSVVSFWGGRSPSVGWGGDAGRKQMTFS